MKVVKVVCISLLSDIYDPKDIEYVHLKIGKIYDSLDDKVKGILPDVKKQYTFIFDEDDMDRNEFNFRQGGDYYPSELFISIEEYRDNVLKGILTN